MRHSRIRHRPVRYYVSKLNTLTLLTQKLKHPACNGIWQTKLYQSGHQDVVVYMLECLVEIDKHNLNRLAIVNSLVPVVHCVDQHIRCRADRHVSNLSLILSSIKEPMNDSRSLLSVAVSEIGCKYVSISCGGCTFGTGIIFASFHTAGTVPSRTEALNIAHTDPESSEQKWRRIQFGKPSGPGAL